MKTMDSVKDYVILSLMNIAKINSLIVNYYLNKQPLPQTTFKIPLLQICKIVHIISKAFLQRAAL